MNEISDMLNNFGGIQPNSLSQILNIDDESDDDVSYLYQDSPYYDMDSIKLFCNRNKGSFQFFP